MSQSEAQRLALKEGLEALPKIGEKETIYCSIRGDHLRILVALAEQAAPAAQEGSDKVNALPDGVVVSAYRVGSGMNEIRVERAQQCDGSDLWAVRQPGSCLNKTGEWEWEPMPSGRDDDFLIRCRFANAREAIGAALASLKGETR